MKTAVAMESAVALTPSRLADYLSLAKPRVAVLVLFTVAAGALLAGGSEGATLAIVFHAVLGTALVASGASALNQWIERFSDGAMRRTENRPLPAGRLQPMEVLAFGWLLALVGVLYLSLLLPPLTAWLAAFTFVSYVFAYTPLKAITPLNTLVGAVPGAMPPVIGWVAVRGRIDPETMALFAVLFLWQVPHFLAIAWIYREEYARAGLRMLPTVDPEGEQTARHMVSWCLALIPASLVPVVLGAGGVLYLVGALLLGLAFLWSALGFQRAPDERSARRVLRASLVYLPGLFVLLLVDQALAWLWLFRVWI
jgi:heme o synthase